jgi:hypothetical protein
MTLAFDTTTDLLSIYLPAEPLSPAQLRLGRRWLDYWLHLGRATGLLLVGAGPAPGSPSHPLHHWLDGHQVDFPRRCARLAFVQPSPEGAGPLPALSASLGCPCQAFANETTARTWLLSQPPLRLSP